MRAQQLTTRVIVWVIARRIVLGCLVLLGCVSPSHRRTRYVELPAGVMRGATRIDWMRFDGMPPYTWGFCLTAHRAATREAARATAAPDRSAPRTGCNGYPFSRMRPAAGL